MEDEKIRLSAEITGEEWNKGIIEEAKRFEKKGLKDKIDYLHKEYDFEYPEFTEKVLSINKARNCLVHRLGILNELDIRNSPTSSLIVEWVKLAIVKRDGDKEYELEIPVALKEGDMIRPIVMECSKEFHFGDRIEFDITEFLNIITTFLLFSQQIEKSILDIQKKRKTKK